MANHENNKLARNIANIKETCVRKRHGSETAWKKKLQPLRHSLLSRARAAANLLPQAQKQRSFSAPTVAKSRSNATVNAGSSVAPTNARNAALQVHKEALGMGTVIVTYKVFPEDIVANFDSLKKKIEEKLPKDASLSGYGEEPVAFGLVALLVQVRFPEDKTGLVDEFESALGAIPGVSQVQTLMVRRSSR